MGEPEPDDRPTVTEALRKLRSPEAGTVALVIPAMPPPAPQTGAGEVTPAPSGVVIAEPRPAPPQGTEKEPAAASAAQLGARARRLKRAAAGMLLLLFFVNYVETGIESWLRGSYGLGTELEQVLGEAAQWFERELNFEQHDATNMLAVYGFSMVYFFFFPFLALAAAVLFYLRRDPRPLLLLAIAVTVDYLLTLPFYVLFPVPERWTYPDSGAVLLSDLWTSKLIQAFRPFSGLNNCFPSFHVSITVVLVACLYRAGTWFRRAALLLGLAVVLSTFALGIHWLSDILAGLACGLVSFHLAERLLPRVERAIALPQGFEVPRAR
jgi:membrane-associated phospholipid phosphatase